MISFTVGKNADLNTFSGSYSGLPSCSSIQSFFFFDPVSVFKTSWPFGLWEQIFSFLLFSTFSCLCVQFVKLALHFVCPLLTEATAKFCDGYAGPESFIRLDSSECKGRDFQQIARAGICTNDWDWNSVLILVAAFTAQPLALQPLHTLFTKFLFILTFFVILHSFCRTAESHWLSSNLKPDGFCQIHAYILSSSKIKVIC